MNVVVTGASRGLGLEFAGQLADRGDRVFATARDPKTSKELQSLIAKYPDRISALTLDVTSEDSIRLAAQEVSAQSGSIDLLINNAGVLLGMSAMKDTGQADRLGRLPWNTASP